MQEMRKNLRAGFFMINFNLLSPFSSLFSLSTCLGKVKWKFYCSLRIVKMLLALLTFPRHFHDLPFNNSREESNFSFFVGYICYYEKMREKSNFVSWMKFSPVFSTTNRQFGSFRYNSITQSRHYKLWLLIRDWNTHRLFGNRKRSLYISNYYRAWRWRQSFTYDWIIQSPVKDAN